MAAFHLHQGEATHGVNEDEMLRQVMLEVMFRDVLGDDDDDDVDDVDDDDHREDDGAANDDALVDALFDASFGKSGATPDIHLPKALRPERTIDVPPSKASKRTGDEVRHDKPRLVLTRHAIAGGVDKNFDLN